MKGILAGDAGKVQSYLDGKTRQAVGAMLNDLLDAEADELCGAKRYERSPDRPDPRSLEHKIGTLSVKVPKLRKVPFEMAIIDRYRRKESSVEEALVAMYLAGVSMRRVEDITEALWGTRVSSSTVSELNQRIYGRIEEWRAAPIEGEHPYVYLDGLWLRRSWGGEVKNVSVPVAVGVNRDGIRDVLGVAEGAKEDAESWRGFLRYLKERGLKGVRLVVSDKCLGLVEALGEFFPEAAWPRCVAHFCRNVMSAGHNQRLNREIRRRTRVVGAFPDGQSALMLMSARLRHMTTTPWGLRRYLNMKLLWAQDAGRSETVANEAAARV